MTRVLNSQSTDEFAASARPGSTGHHAKPWLSVIMPVYRGERWLDASLGSLAAEADAGVEVIVIDSSPSPASRDIASRYADRLRMRIVQTGETLTWHLKTNLGVELSQAEHICWLHCDDLWLPGRAQAVRSWIEEAPESALHIAPSAIVDTAGRALGHWRCPFGKAGEIPQELALERLLVQNFIAAPAPVVRKDAWMAAGGLDAELWYTADWDMWLKLAAHGPVRFHDRVTSSFRIHDESQTVTGSRNAGDFERQMQIVRDRHLVRLQGGRGAVERASQTSIAVNSALAAAAAGELGRLVPAALQILGLGPRGIYRYFRDSRIIDRVVPRLRARLAGAF
jgi:GT2 family glycosyltransferase